jgi:hypothetical protein
MAMAAIALDAGLLLQQTLMTDVSLLLAGGPQFFRIKGKALGSTLVRVARNSKSIPEAWLRVVVLRPRHLKLSIRPVQVRDGQGQLVLHCKKNFDSKVLLNRVNAIWRPQANLVFDPGLFDPVVMDDEAAIAKALADGSTKARLPQVVEFDAFESMFKGLKDPKASFTIFLVERITHGGNTVRGVTSTKGGFALVSDIGRDEDEKSMAHEIGHYFGTLAKGSLYDDDVSSDDLLMCPGTEGTKVPFKDAIKYFNTNYK